MNKITESIVKPAEALNTTKTPDAPHGGRDLSSRIHAGWIFTLCTVVVIAMLGASIYVFLFEKNPTELQSELAIIFAGVAISVVMGLLFESVANKSEARGTVQMVSFVVAGSGAYLLIFLLCYSLIFMNRHKQSADPMSVKNLCEIVRDVERNEGWTDFTNWKNGIGRLLTVFNHDEEFNLQHLLSRVYYHGDNQHKLKEPLIQTAFLYAPAAADRTTPLIKIQRIYGKKIKDEAKIYVTATGSTSEGKPRAMLFVKDTAGNVVCPTNKESWVDVPDDPVDCLVVAIYSGEEIPSGDFDIVDPTKYIQTSNNESQATIDLAVLAPLSTVSNRLWEVRGADGATDDIPLLFRKLPITPREDVEELASQEGIKWWLNWMDNKVKTGEGAEAVLLTNALSIIQRNSTNITFSNSLRNAAFLNKTAYHLTEMTKPVILTFLWGTNAAPLAMRSSQASEPAQSPSP